MAEKPVVGVIGGSGLYDIAGLTKQITYDLDTPFGKPSSPLVRGELAGHQVVFLARHGIGHTISPSEVNYRANIYALKNLGVENVVSISACGSLREDFIPGEIVIPDQLFDFTRGTRQRSFFGEGMVVHVGSANPYCPSLSEKVYQAVSQTGASVHKGGPLITIEGPRFSTRAESNLFRAWGMTIIGMTACPEAFLAREAEMCYTTMAHVTDYDVWHSNEEPVTLDMVLKTLKKNTSVAQQALINLLDKLNEEPDCECRDALASSIVTQREIVPPETLKKVDLLIRKYS
jgi:5'-methylthioadenosine phosphorylase